MRRVPGFTSGAWCLCLHLFAGAGTAQAHGWWPPKHGGLMNLGGEISFELVAGEHRLTIHVEDHGIPVPTTGAVGELTVGGPDGRRSVPITEAGDNRLQGPALPLQDGQRVKMTATLASGLYLVGYFVVGQPPAQEVPTLRFAEPVWRPGGFK